MIINNWEDIQFVIDHKSSDIIKWLCLWDIVSCEEAEDSNNHGKYKYEHKTYTLVNISLISKNVCNKKIQYEYNNIQQYSDAKFRIRNFLHELNYLEVSIPTLTDWETSSKARSFETYHIHTKKKLYLRKTLDSFLRMLSCSDLNKIYCIWPCFRNEKLTSYTPSEFEMLSVFTNYMSQNSAINLAIKLLKIILNINNVRIVNITNNNYLKRHANWIFYLISWFIDENNNYSSKSDNWYLDEFIIKYNDVTIIHWVKEIINYDEYIKKLYAQWKRDNYWELQKLEDLINSWAPICYNIGVSIIRTLASYYNKRLKDYDLFLLNRISHG